MRWTNIERGTRLRFAYTNWQNENEIRNVIVVGLQYGSNEWHPEPQWFVHCWDPSRKNYRSFALAKIDVLTLEVDPPL
jgi:hypothetical protein